MKKFAILLLIAIAGCPFGAFAQDEIFDNPDNKVYFGARLGLDISCPGDASLNGVSVDLFKNGAGFDAGAVLNIPLWKNLYFEPGLSLYYNTMGINVEMIDSEGNPAGTEMDASIRRFGFRIPFQIGYRFDFQPVAISVFTGPVINIGIIGRTHASAKYNGIKESDSESCFDDINRMGLGWKFGVGATYGPYVFQISGTAGMTDSMKGPFKMHDNNIAITLGYNFGF